MKKLTLFILPILLFACKKDKDVILTIGETDDYVLTNHNVSAQGFDDGPTYNGESVDIDLNGDGGKDIRFLSFQDSVTSPDLASNYWVEGVILNDYFTILENSGSDVEYEVFTTTYDYFGTYPRETTVIESYCEFVEGAVYNDNNRRKASNFQKSEKINKDVVFEAKYDMSAQSFMIYESSAEESYYLFNEAEDSLIGQHRIPGSVCGSAPYNEEFYIAFEYNAGGIVQYGWIQMIITNNNKVTINFSGISDV